ncbi:hypothetical protein F2Q70_00044081 [Brassica cretica]|uniref:Uncharacterized protein n=1 Tax=Brassica cretica TaxID=69181 RepID=A0A8S9KKD8_BRACR|nr:hypothetical protein F2Q70_00044081 [Brassica cretica]
MLKLSQTRKDFQTYCQFSMTMHMSRWQTDRAVYRINPRTSGKELWLEPRPDDRTYHTRARLFRPSRHSKDNSRARLKLGHEEPKDRHAFSSGGPSGQSRVRPSPYRIGHSQFG